MEEAIITFAVMLRELKFSEIKKTEDGKTVVVLRETVQEKQEHLLIMKKSKTDNISEIYATIYGTDLRA